MDFIYQLGGARKLDSDIEVEFHNPRRQRRVHAVSAAIAAPVHARAHDLRPRVHVLARRRDDSRAEADDSVAEHGALPRRPCRRGRDGLSGHGRVLGRPHRGLSRGGLAPRRARLHLSAAGRHEPRLPQRSGAARPRDRDRRRSRPPARVLHPPSQPGHREPARRHVHHDAPVPRQLPLVVVRLGRLRARGGGAAERPRRSTGSSWSTTTSAPAASSRCASCRPASSSCSAS